MNPMDPQIPPQLNDQVLAQLLHEKEMEEEQKRKQPGVLRNVVDQAISGESTLGKGIHGAVGLAAAPFALGKNLLSTKYIPGGAPFTVDV